MATRPFLARHTVALDQRGYSPGRTARSAARTLDGRHGAARSGVSSQRRGESAAPEGALGGAGAPAALSSGAACRTEVVAALRALPAEYSSVIVETFYRGRNVPETADVLGVSDDIVKARCYDALHALKHALAEHGSLHDRRRGDAD